LGLKRSLGRLNVDLALMRHAVGERGAGELAVSFDHAEAAASLPIKHGDPFEHMLVAQATFEGLSLLTRDKSLLAYGNVVHLV
jgi:PIN domain nuclease of toxin-antitoxin system